jgi:hypothetical protein
MAGPPLHRLQATNPSDFGSKGFPFPLVIMICFCKSLRRLAEYWSGFLRILHWLHGMLEECQEGACRWTSDLEAYVGGSGTLLYFASSLLEAIAAGFWRSSG